MDLPKRLPYQHYKILVYMLYASDGQFSYIRRDKCKFEVKTPALKTRFQMKSHRIHEIFRKLEEVGYIYNLEISIGLMRFIVHLPHWLTFSDREREGTTPIGMYHAGTKSKLGETP